MTSKFRNSANQRLTRGLFKEYGGNVYTLKEVDQNGIPSLRRLYIECADVTEHRFATAHLEGWDHWQLLLSSPELRSEIDLWRAELQVKLRSDAIAKILEETQDPGNRGYMQALRYLADKTYMEVDNPKRPRGRPRKEEENLSDIELVRLEQDAERILKGKTIN